MDFREFKEKYQKKEVEEVSHSPPKEPLLSVLVQTYQQKDYIKECLDSILMQETSFDFEILLGDDGSTDDTREICLQYAEKYPDRIRLFLHHRENQIQVLGEATSNFNAFYNFYSARGKYIAFCEGDDKWTDPLKLEKQVAYLEKNSSISFTYHKFETVDENGKGFSGILRNTQPLKDLIKEDLLKVKYHPLLVTICFRRNQVKFPKEIVQVLNIDTFLLSLFGEIGDAKFQNKILPSFYRFRREGTWSKKLRFKKLLSKIHTFKCLATYYKSKHHTDLNNYFLNQMKQNYKMLIFLHLKNINFSLAGRTMVEYYTISKSKKV